VVDVTAIRSILDLDADGAAGLFDELLASFRDDGEARLTTLRDALDAGDSDLICRIAHTFRGEALAWGAEQLADRCRLLEDDVTAGCAIDPVTVERLTEQFRSTVSALESMRVGTA
jgi:HPt (histidine-containing phosphotransfer) domain-containing protein